MRLLRVGRKISTLAITIALAAAVSFSGCGKKDDAATGANGSNPYPPVPGSGNTGGGTLSSNKNLAGLHSRFPQSFVTPAPWAGYWWPYAQNGISSGARKYEQAGGGSGASSWEVGHHGNGLGDVADWWGHCNGWAAAALLAPEPKGPKAIGGVTFDVADRKALLSETFMEVTGDFLGTRVDDPGDTSSEAFNDIHPAQFYLMLSSLIGGQRRSFVMDRYTGYQVWNHPVVGFIHAPITRDDYLGPDPEFPNIHRVNVATKIFWVSDNVEPGIVTPAFDPNNLSDAFDSRVLRYELWLDAPPVFNADGNLESSGNIILTSSNGRVVGGQWKNSSLPAENSHPDYMWVPTGPAPSSGYKNPQLSDQWVLSNVRGD